MKKLNKIQTELKAPKSQLNSFGKYKYRNCEDILEAVKPFLDGCTLTLNDEIVMIGDRYYVKATATIKDGEESVSVSAFAREGENKKGMDDSQLTGATSSYARKYALNGLFCIDDTKDSDTTNNGKDEHSDVALIEKVEEELFRANTKEQVMTIYNRYKGQGAEVEKIIIAKGKTF